ncbi:nucleoside triphosphate hydrolase [Corynebacterium sp. sy017]|uniref:MazG nucleotide pyrophosphohydrolase domain-containing protein n=1 Tax=unclassified Corynebacterium TaxID=2624378 RepID=UPI001184B19E|nr:MULTISPECIES: MazG nucleotide pyrophosphohydrolase domain-containing protein [unclassified Corynebacterium]MBP3088893.1 nucleoside triphosphate hydrolase [Corynebacterium sp. sy017]QDZ42276.1 nucleoside triphosphate hydrolase [Corynebacterium sp. sy039]TSD91226.1 nucleoside triphosphate hydrolase [Corynebacterium sp. SY003]
MIVLLLDPRWPTMIPYSVIAQLRGKVQFTTEVPVKVRWDFDEFLHKDIYYSDLGTLLVSTDEWAPEVRAALAQGAQLIEVPSRADSIGQAVAAMERAVKIGEWEQEQTHESLIPFLEEETQEVIEAIRHRSSDQQLCQELGDILLQVLFHAEIAARRGAFSFADVAASYVEKMRSRAPYLFDGTDTLVPESEQHRLWAAGKASEKS